uniref:Uncharacterized protein n=1 Tax=Corvus moneduloides TaxID=1196302 RepID=A0A8C3ECU4_CORMO
VWKSLQLFPCQCLGTLAITPCQLRRSNTKSFPGCEPERFYFAYRIHEKNAKEEVKAQEHMERRIQAVLSLKTSITSNRVLLLSWDGNEVTDLGDCWVLMQVMSVFLAELAFRELQKSRKMEIVSRILQEKASIHKQKKSQSPTKAIKARGKLEGPLLQRREAWQSEETCKHADGEISQVPKAEDPTRLAIRAMRKRMAEKKMEELRTGILHKQTVPGWGHKGCAFHSKPSCIHFKDFDVGQIYKKKIVLTNASYSVNYCRLVGISECLKDFINVHFDPPGKVSSGMSCEFLVTFKPMINEGLEGEVMFMAQTGPFSVPLKCTVKTCILALDKELIDFGSLVVGETISQTISLTNSGALGTRFKLLSKLSSSSLWETSLLISDQQFSLRRTENPTSFRNCKIVNIILVSATESPLLRIVTEGEIGPFSSVKIPVLFVPAVPGDVRAEFVIVFDNPDCKPLNFSAIGVSVDVPIWVPQPSVDLRICLYERLYQDSVEVRSRATTTLRLKFEVCRELSKHMELLPKTGYIQAQSSFSAQLKFLPRQSLPEDAGSYFNAETGILEVPVTILLVDKAKKVNFTVHAIVTTSDLEISPAQINFGYCTIYEAVQANVILTNKSILPQEFGFVGLPEFVEVQPNDGFGIILPLESLTLDIIFKATKAKEYSFELTCRTEINRQFKLSCKAVGVHPPLELSHSLVQFAATALNSMSSATLNVINSHVDGNPLTHPVPRIGSGDPVPVGPTSFEFHVPRDCPVTITPSVGTVLPGQKSSIRVSFSPALSDQQIGEEAARRLSAAAVPEAGVQVRNAKNSTCCWSVTSRYFKYLFDLFLALSLTEIILTPGFSSSDSYRAAQASLMRSFRGSFNKYIIPCFVASATPCDTADPCPHNTLYLELHCPAVAPPVLITSDTGNNVANFGDIAVGQRMLKRITIENISPGKLELGFSVLNPNGPFLLVRAVGMLEPGESKPLILSFCPREDKWFLETLDIQVAKTNLSLRLSGHGVMPSTVCSVGEVLDMGYVMARDTVTSTIENTSTLTLPFSVQLESLSPARDRDRQKIPSFLTSSVQRTEIVGTQNYNGFSVFSVSPTGGKIEAGESQDFVVTFSPDHESLYYSDRLKVLLFGKQTAHEIQLKGAARDHPMFVEGGVPLDVPVESLAVTSPVASQKALEREAVKSLLLLLEYVEGSAEPARAELTVGAMQSPLLAAKKVREIKPAGLCQVL